MQNICGQFLTLFAVVQAKTEEALNYLNKHVTTVSESTSRPKQSEVVVLESTWDMKLGSKTFWSPDSSG